jgi:hypothetical protein
MILSSSPVIANIIITGSLYGRYFQDP